MITYYGRKQLGQVVSLWCQTVNTSFVPTNPSAAPVARIYNSAGATVLTQKLPIIDSGDTDGLFSYPLFLDGRFADGNYDVLFTYTVGSDNLQQMARFEVIAGGAAKGTVQAMFTYRRPESQLIVEETDAGILTARRNPH